MIYLPPNSLEIKSFFPRTCGEIYQMLISPESFLHPSPLGLNWQLLSCQFNPQVGEKIHLHFGLEWKPHNQLSISALVVKAICDQELELKWFDERFPQHESLLQLRLQNAQGGCELTLTHSSFTQAKMCRLYLRTWMKILAAFEKK